MLLGSQVAASPSDFCWLAGPDAASRLRGSLANAVRCALLRRWAPFCHASLRATTWSIWTALLVLLPRVKAMVVAVYGSAREPVRTMQFFVPGLKVVALRSRARMSLRVSQPLWSVSDHAGPNSSRL